MRHLNPFWWLVVLAIASCSTQNPATHDAGPDSSTRDAGPRSDAEPVVDAGNLRDASLPSDSGVSRTAIVGTVSAPAVSVEGLDAIAGARISMGGATTTTDELGRFLLPATPGRHLVFARGPDDPTEVGAERLARTWAWVDVVEGEIAFVDLTLARGCMLTVSGRRGGLVETSQCGVGGLRLDVPPRAFVDEAGRVVDATIVLAAAHSSRARPLSLLGLPQVPSDDDVDDDVAFVAGIDISAFDVHGRPLSIRTEESVGVWIEVPGDTPSDPHFEWAEDGASTWVRQVGELRDVGTLRYAYLKVNHFSAGRISVVGMGAHGCLNIEARVCPPGGPCAFREGVRYQLVTRTGVVRTGTLTGCIGFTGSPGEVRYALQLRWASDILTGLLGEPIYTSGGTRALELRSATPVECPDDCTTERFDLHAQPVSCISGRFESACGLGCSEPTWGRIVASTGGVRVSTRYLLSSCDGRLCMPVPSTPMDVYLEDELGHRLRVSGPISSAGSCFPATGPAVECDDAASGCTPIVGSGACAGTECLSAAFTLTTAVSSDCPGGTQLVTLDASATRGDADIYEWFAYTIDPTSGDRIPIDYLYSAYDETATMCLPTGDHVIVLVTRSHVDSIRHSTAEEVVRIESMCVPGVLDIDGTWDVSLLCTAGLTSPSCTLADPSGVWTFNVVRSGAAVDVEDGGGNIFAGSQCSETFEFGGAVGPGHHVSHGWYERADGTMRAEAVFSEDRVCTWNCVGAAMRR